MRKRFSLFFSLSVVAIMTLAACGGGDDENGGDSGDGGDGGSSGSISMEMDEFLFDPDSISASAGDEMTVELENVGNELHDFTIDEDAWSGDRVHTEAASGESTTAEFTIPEDASGDVTFYCSVPGHREQGMEGTLTIE